MNYGELKSAIADETHTTANAGVVAKIPRFIRRTEDLLARRLRVTQFEGSTTLDDTDRVSTETGLYTAPLGLLEVRRLCNEDGLPLTQRSVGAIRLRLASASPMEFAVVGAMLEVRGVPGADTELELDYFGTLARLADDADENALLSAHEALYMHGGMHYLYRHTQDRELAADELELLNDAIDQLNEAEGRKLGGAAAAEGYNFGAGGGY